MTSKQEIQEFVEFQLESMDYIKNFSEIDKNINYDVPFPSSHSLEKFEMVQRCQNKFNIVIDIEDIKHGWDTEMFVDFLYDKINKIISMKKFVKIAKGVQQMSDDELKNRIAYLEDRIQRQVFLDAPTIDVLMEIQMISQRIMEIAKKELKAENQQMLDSNDTKWNVIPKGDDKKYWLNEYGKREWKLASNEKFTAERPYYWCDRVITLDKNRVVIQDITFTDFMEANEKSAVEQFIPVLPEPEKEKIIYRKDGQPFYLQQNGLYQARDEHGVVTLEYDDRRKDV
jgi:hypothetical protein